MARFTFLSFYAAIFSGHVFIAFSVSYRKESISVNTKTKLIARVMDGDSSEVETTSCATTSRNFGVINIESLLHFSAIFPLQKSSFTSNVSMIEIRFRKRIGVEWLSNGIEKPALIFLKVSAK